MTAEARLRQLQRLDSLGALTAGIAHDFNNLLTAMTGNLSLLRMDLEETSTGSPYLDELELAVEGATRLSAKLLSYAGRARRATSVVDVNALVADTTRLASLSFPQGVNVRLELAPELPTITGDIAQVQQVVLNLLTNAAQACERGAGEVTVTTRLETLGEDELRERFVGQLLSSGQFVMLSVSDTGRGMDAATRRRIFEPFYSTKSSGHGLGLYAVMTILKAHDAGFAVHTEPGEGSTFVACFPREQKEVATLRPNAQARQRAAAQGVVLVVEDEPAVRHVACNMLAKLGYEVIEAEDGRVAIEQLERSAVQVRAVFMDLIMPGRSAREVAPEIHRRWPELPILVTSGYARRDAFKELSGHGVRGFLQKPYDLNELADAMDHLFDPRPRGDVIIPS
jgi:nitrogen-specific signal transduction histidine kinase